MVADVRVLVRLCGRHLLTQVIDIARTSADDELVEFCFKGEYDR
jgi:hypothetical protein